MFIYIILRGPSRQGIDINIDINIERERERLGEKGSERNWLSESATIRKCTWAMNMKGNREGEVHGEREGGMQGHVSGAWLVTNSFIEITAARQLTPSCQGVILHCGFFDYRYLYYQLLAHSKM